MIWLLPVIVIGGLVYPLLGYLMVVMAAYFLPISYFKKRYWCWHLCPRGAFLDIALSKFSAKKPVPRIFAKRWFRWSIFALFMSIVILRMISSGGHLLTIGAIFVSVCLITTVIAIIIGVATRHRGWCAICPMGTLQEAIGSIRNRHA
jgi:polyferredoxin